MSGKISRKELNTDLNNELDNFANSIAAHLADYSSYASGKDGDIYTVVDFKRADNTLYLKSTLSNKDENGNFQTCTLQYYDDTGITVIKTVIWTFTYDADGNIVIKVVA